MAKKIEYPFEFEGDVQKYTEKIKSLRYGNQVRSSIAESINVLAAKVQKALNDYVGEIKTKHDAVDSAYQEVSSQYLDIQNYIIEINRFITTYNSLKDAIENYSNATLETSDYTETTVRTGVKRWTPQAPTMTWVDNNVIVENEETHEMEERNLGYWLWTVPRCPEFRTLNWEWVYKKPGVTYEDSISFDPNEGILNIKARDFLSDMQIIARKIRFDQQPTASMQIAANGKHQLTLELPQGPAGSGSEGLANRPYFYTLYEADDSAWLPNASNPPYFGKGPLVDLITTFGENNQTITYLGDFFDENSDYEYIYDGVYITFRKSVDNYTGGTKFNLLRNNFGTSPTGELATNNVDFDSTITIFLPREQSATVTFVDDQGRTYCRRVHWMTKSESWVEAVGQVDGTGKPKANLATVDRFMTYSQFELIKDTQGLVAARTFNNSNNVDEHFYMLLFEDAFMPGKGTARKGCTPDWAATSDTYRNNNDVAYGQSSDFRLNDIQTTNLKTQTDNAEGMNHRYDQFLIPIKVVGVSYHLNEKDIGANIFGSVQESSSSSSGGSGGSDNSGEEGDFSEEP